MKNPNREKVLFVLNRPIVYEFGEKGEIRTIDQFEIWKPLAGNIKKVGITKDFNLKDIIDLTADCSEMTVPMLDLMEFEDLNRMAEVIMGFFFSGDKSADGTSSTPNQSS